MPNGTDSEGEFSRRQWMQAVGLTGAASLAGCTGDGNGNGNGNGGNGNGGNGNGNGGNGGNGNGGNGNGGSGRRFNYMRGGTHFPNLNWNQFSENHNSTIKNFFDTIGAWTRRDNNEVDRLGYDDWNYDADSRTLSVTLRDDITFWNGDQYTAEDHYAYYELLRAQNPEGSPFESIEATGDYTVEFTTKEAQNPEILYRMRVAGRWFEFGEQVWGEWLEQYQDASDQQTRDSITEELTNDFEITNDDLVEEGYGTGPYMIDEVTDQYMDLVAYEDHYIWQGNDDRFDPNIERIRMWYADETGTRDQRIANEDVDFAGKGFMAYNHSWEDYEGQLPDYWEQLAYEPSINPLKMLINHRNKDYLQDVNFRRAMAAAIDFENAALNVQEYPVEVHSGMHQSFNQSYWGSENPDDLIDYGINSDPELAQQFLDASDFELDGGSVYGPDGEQRDPMTFVIGGSNWGDVAQVAANMLDQFGFPIEERNVDRTTKLNIVQENETMTEWDLSTETHYAGTSLHPHEYFRPNSFWGWRVGPASFGPAAEYGSQVQSWLEDGETHSPYNGKPMVFEIPEEVGSTDLSGSTKEINIPGLYDEIRSPVDEERDRQIIRDLSWAWNYTLPDIDMVFAVTDLFGNTQGYEWADSSDLIGANHVINWFSQGLVRFSE